MKAEIEAILARETDSAKIAEALEQLVHQKLNPPRQPWGVLEYAGVGLATMFFGIWGAIGIGSHRRAVKDAYEQGRRER